MTPFDDLMSHCFKSDCTNGPSVMACLSAALELSKMAARWMPGICLGRCADADDNLVAIDPYKVLCTLLG
eukprot:16078961-Heterocapsa_arctica.AAC.1